MRGSRSVNYRHGTAAPRAVMALFMMGIGSEIARVRTCNGRGAIILWILCG